MLILRSAAAAEATTWNPLDKDPLVNLTNNNMTMAGTVNASPYRAARSTTSRNPGKWYFEGVATWGYLGLASADAPLNSTNMAACTDYTGGTTVTALRAYTGTVPYAWLVDVDTDRLAFAVNQTDLRFWVKNLTTGGQWTNFASTAGGDPENNIGGNDNIFQTSPELGGVLYLMGASGWGGTVTIYPGPTSGIGTPPGGFRWWDRE